MQRVTFINCPLSARLRGEREASVSERGEVGSGGTDHLTLPVAAQRAPSLSPADAAERAI